MTQKVPSGAEVVVEAAGPKGTGLGLATVKHNVELYGGTAGTG